MSCDDYYDTRSDSGGYQQHSAKQPASRCNVGLGLNMQHPNKKKTNFNHPQYPPSAQIAGGEMGKLLFTASQWQEFESQTMIYKYIMASIPVPPQLLIPLSIQSNRSGTDLRFSNGSDPEPWRCRRTDGKKWRCSKDAMPEQKYCDRHAHKNRTRSRKPVETQFHNTKLPSYPFRSEPNYHPILPPAPSLPTSCQQCRFTKSGTFPLSSLNQKIQKPIMHSVSVGSKRDHFCHQDLVGNHQDDCSLTLSMQSCGDGVFQMGIGMLNADGSNPPSQWVNQGGWLGLGGPLGEALCLGIACTQKEPPNVSSLHGHSNSATSNQDT